MSKRKQIVECKSVADVVYWLQAAGIAFAVGYQINDYFRLTQRLGDAIDAVREAMMFMRYGSTLADLERAISTLEQAGITVPAEIQSIANDPREGNDSEIPATNIAMARAWLDSALQHLREAQAQAQNGDSTELRSDQEPREEKGDVTTEVKSAGAHDLYR